MPKKGILIVDDNEDFRELIADIVKLFGYAVFLAENGEEAVRFFQTGGDIEVEAVVTDRRMPIMGGEELTRWIKSRYPSIKVIFASSDHIKEFGPVARAAGADIVLHKDPANIVNDFSGALKAL